MLEVGDIGKPEAVGSGMLDVVSAGVTGFCSEFTCAVSNES